MNQTQTVHKWRTISEYVDINTGEFIKKNIVKYNYDIINKTKKIEIKEYYGIIKYTNECVRKRQTKLW
jgi:hypothetical protein